MNKYFFILIFFLTGCINDFRAGKEPYEPCIRNGSHSPMNSVVFKNTLSYSVYYYYNIVHDTFDCKKFTYKGIVTSQAYTNQGSLVLYVPPGSVAHIYFTKKYYDISNIDTLCSPAVKPFIVKKFESIIGETNSDNNVQSCILKIDEEK